MTVSPNINPWRKTPPANLHQFDSLDLTGATRLCILNEIDQAKRSGLIRESLGQRARRVTDDARAKGLLRFVPATQDTQEGVGTDGVAVSQAGEDDAAQGRLGGQGGAP
jgi:hypothetical protein